MIILIRNITQRYLLCIGGLYYDELRIISIMGRLKYYIIEPSDT
jgi:hypothetical protein